MPSQQKGDGRAMGHKELEGMPAALVARAYVASVTGTMKGQVLDVNGYA